MVVINKASIFLSLNPNRVESISFFFTRIWDCEAAAAVIKEHE